MQTSGLIDGEFDWDAQQQGVVLGAYFYGFFITMVPGGYVAERNGSKLVILLATLGSSICALLTPVAARQGGKSWVIATRALQGLARVS